MFTLINGEVQGFSNELLIYSVIGAFALICVLEYVFRIFAPIKAAPLFSAIPALVLLILMRRTDNYEFIKVVIITAVILRLLFVFIPSVEKVMIYGSFALDALSLFLCFYEKRLTGYSSTDKYLFAALVLLTLSGIKAKFPFYFFVLLGIILFAVPVKQEPIDWSILIRLGEKISEGVESALFADSYTTGYSSLHVSGGKARKNTKNQLILTMDERPYFIYEDEETHKSMMVRKDLYLSGGMGAQKEKLVDFLGFLHENDVDKETAQLFSKLSKVYVEYDHIDTFDEIVPEGTYQIINANDRQEITKGISEKKHKKGYRIETRFLDVDYGSPYLLAIIENSFSEEALVQMTYQEACDYARELYGLELDKIIDEDEYGTIISKGYDESDLNVDAASQRMTDLAKEITKEAKNDYEKCRLIEAYLRQYPYSTDAVGGYDQNSDMSSVAGMADIADRFLFDSGKGYCVHYASAMVMLLRLSGIPARAMLGYHYEFPFEKSLSYEVSANCAHIWPEAYIENVGWISFEPTGAYHTAIDYTWHKKAKDKVNAELSTKYEGAKDIILPDNLMIPEEEEYEEPEEKPRRQLLFETLRIGILLLCSIVILIVVLILGRMAFWNIRYNKASSDKKLQMDVEAIKKLLLKKSQKEFFDRGLLSDFLPLFPDSLKKDASRVFDAYYRMQYAPGMEKILSTLENELARNLREMLKKEFKK